MSLPAGWTTAAVGEVIELNPKSAAPDVTPVGFVPMQSLGTRFRSKLGFEPRLWGDVKKAYTHFGDGDVLLAKITPCFENGKAGLALGLPSGLGAGSSEFFVCRPMPQTIDPRYLLAWVSGDDFRARATVQMTGSVGHKRVPKDFLLGDALPLAPFPEQQRIADKLETVLARVDSCRDRLARVAPLLKRFRQSVLAAATSGRLTEDWQLRSEASAWVEMQIQSVAEVGTGSTPLRSNPDYFAPSGTPWVTSGATSKPFVTAAEEFVTDAAIKAHRLKLYPPGTLLVAMYGEGKTRGQVTELSIAATINQACAAVRVDESLARVGYVKLALQANYFEMRELAEGGNQPNLNLGKLKEFGLKLPTLEEQSEIVRRVDTLFAFADRLETRLAQAQTAVDRLTPSLLAKAFRGELVPQDPADEPAAELLKRLAAQREAEPAKPRRKRATA